MTKIANKIIHVALVLDASGSMARLASKVIQVADDQIKHLKTLSEELDTEIRVTVYSFSYSSRIQCLIFDKDVFRLPSIKDLYITGGQTALVDATLKSQDDLTKTAQMYGEHHFRTYVVTDGMENDSRARSGELWNRLTHQGDNWSVAVLVPDESGKRYAVNAGFAAGNIMIWDATSVAGLEKAATQIKESTQSFVTSVSRGVAYDKNNVFGGTAQLNAQTVQSLTPLTPGSFVFWDVTRDERIDEFVRRNNKQSFNVGRGYYQLQGRLVTVQADKDIVILENATGKVYGGIDAVRQLLGLPKGVNVKIKADSNPDYTIFVKSTANNRKLLAGTKLFYLR